MRYSNEELKQILEELRARPVGNDFRCSPKMRRALLESDLLTDGERNEIEGHIPREGYSITGMPYHGLPA